LSSPNQPHRLLFEFQRVSRPNHFHHANPSNTNPTQSALGDVFRGQGLASWSAQLGHLGKWEFADKGEGLQTALTSLLTGLKESIIP
jgi:hypothetical protein